MKYQRGVRGKSYIVCMRHTYSLDSCVCYFQLLVLPPTRYHFWDSVVADKQNQGIKILTDYKYLSNAIVKANAITDCIVSAHRVSQLPVALIYKLHYSLTACSTDVLLLCSSRALATTNGMTPEAKVPKPIMAITWNISLWLKCSWIPMPVTCHMKEAINTIQPASARIEARESCCSSVDCLR